MGALSVERRRFRIKNGHQARHVALPRDAEADGSAVVEVWAAAEPPGGALRGGATQRVPWQPKAKNLSFIDTASAYSIRGVLDRSFTLFRMTSGGVER